MYIKKGQILQSFAAGHLKAASLAHFPISFALF